MKKQLHIAPQSIIILAIIANSVRFLTLIGTYILEKIIDENGPITDMLYNSVVSVAMIVSLGLILRLNKIGFYLFLGIQIINAFFAGSICEKQDVSALVSLLMIIFLSSLLLLKKNGMNAYQAMGIIKNEDDDDDEEIQNE